MEDLIVAYRAGLMTDDRMQHIAYLHLIEMEPEYLPLRGQRLDWRLLLELNSLKLLLLERLAMLFLLSYREQHSYHNSELSPKINRSHALNTPRYVATMKCFLLRDTPRNFNLMARLLIYNHEVLPEVMSVTGPSVERRGEGAGR